MNTPNTQTMTKFRDLAIGQEFDFIEDGSIYNSFFEPCRKTGQRTYVAIHQDGTVNGRYGKMRVGSIETPVYHVGNVRPLDLNTRWETRHGFPPHVIQPKR